MPYKIPYVGLQCARVSFRTGPAPARPGLKDDISVSVSQFKIKSMKCKKSRLHTHDKAARASAIFLTCRSWIFCSKIHGLGKALAIGLHKNVIHIFFNNWYSADVHSAVGWYLHLLHRRMRISHIRIQRSHASSGLVHDRSQKKNIRCTSTA